jgi:hypothetical protein
MRHALHERREMHHATLDVGFDRRIVFHIGLRIGIR